MNVDSTMPPTTTQCPDCGLAIPRDIMSWHVCRTGQWIWVKERLPQSHILVLTFDPELAAQYECPQKGVRFYHIEETPWGLYWIGDHNYVDRDELVTKSPITHWMPFPRLPKEVTQ